MERVRHTATLYIIEGKKRKNSPIPNSLEELRRSDVKVIDFEDDLQFLAPHNDKDIFPNLERREDNIISFPVKPRGKSA